MGIKYATNDPCTTILRGSWHTTNYHLTNWRMLKAQKRLEASDICIAVLAQSLGFESESS